jgi:hypothetical protein
VTRFDEISDVSYARNSVSFSCDKTGKNWSERRP